MEIAPHGGVQAALRSVPRAPCDWAGSPRLTPSTLCRDATGAARKVSRTLRMRVSILTTRKRLFCSAAASLGTTRRRKIADCLGRTGFFGLAVVQAPRDFRLEIFAQVFRYDPGRGQALQVVHGELWQERQHGGKHGRGMAHQSHANIVRQRALTTPAEGGTA